MVVLATMISTVLGCLRLQAPMPAPTNGSACPNGMVPATMISTVSVQAPMPAHAMGDACYNDVHPLDAGADACTFEWWCLLQ